MLLRKAHSKLLSAKRGEKCYFLQLQLQEGESFFTQNISVSDRGLLNAFIPYYLFSRAPVGIIIRFLKS
jgi:hypothetical protein